MFKSYTFTNLQALHTTLIAFSFTNLLMLMGANVVDFTVMLAKDVKEDSF